MKELKTILTSFLVIMHFGCIEKEIQKIATQKSKATQIAPIYNDIINEIGFVKHSNLNDFRIPTPPPPVEVLPEPIEIVYQVTDSIFEPTTLTITPYTPCRCAPAPLQLIKLIDTTLNPIDTSSTLPDPIPLLSNKFKTVVYPNPTKGQSTIALNIFQEEKFDIIIYNTNGQIVTPIYNGLLTEGEQLFSIDLSEYEKGIYIIKATSNTQNETLKLIKH